MTEDQGRTRAAPSPSRSGTAERDRGLTSGAGEPRLPPASPGARPATLPVRASRGWPQPGPPGSHTSSLPACRHLGPLRQGPGCTRIGISGRGPTNADLHFRLAGAPTASIRRVVERRVFDEPTAGEERMVGEVGVEYASSLGVRCVLLVPVPSDTLQEAKDNPRGVCGGPCTVSGRCDSPQAVRG